MRACPGLISRPDHLKQQAEIIGLNEKQLHTGVELNLILLTHLKKAQRESKESDWKCDFNSNLEPH